jgi:LmbE family N-acetylglucosaminyl deacetylase
MKGLRLAHPGDRLTLLCLGAHSDDIEIGLGGTLLELLSAGIDVTVHWWVFSANDQRAREATNSADALLAGHRPPLIQLGSFRDSYFPTERATIKEWIEEHRSAVVPDVIFTHRRDDAHQDHRIVSELTWNAFRNHFILEYEIPKWDGDLGHPNIYVPISATAMEKKIQLLMTHFGTQRSKDWFNAATFTGLASIRGIECRAPENFAEAFYMRKATLSFD